MKTVYQNPCRETARLRCDVPVELYKSHCDVSILLQCRPCKIKYTEVNVLIILRIARSSIFCKRVKVRFQYYLTPLMQSVTTNLTGIWLKISRQCNFPVKGESVFIFEGLLKGDLRSYSIIWKPALRSRVPASWKLSWYFPIFKTTRVGNIF